MIYEKKTEVSLLDELSGNLMVFEHFKRKKIKHFINHV